MAENQTVRGTIERPAGEDQGIGARFTTGQVAAAFGIEEATVVRAVTVFLRGAGPDGAGVTLPSGRMVDLSRLGSWVWRLVIWRLRLNGCGRRRRVAGTWCTSIMRVHSD